MVVSLPLGITRVHALTGTVCLVDSSAIFLSNPCPSSPAVFSGPVGQQVRIGVFIGDSDSFNAFDITLLADLTFLKPAGIDLTDTVLNSAAGPATTVLECLNGAVIVGTVCSSPDTAGTIHLGATTAPGAPLTTAPTTGVLFTAIFNITGTTSAAGIPLMFQTGCSQSSVSGGICITIANGSSTLVPEAIQTGTFQNSGSASMAYVVISSSQTSFGPEFPGTTNTATITATSNNGYPPTSVTDAVNFTAITPASLKLSATLSPSSCSTSGSSCSTTLTLTGSAAGTYFATVYGTYATVDGSGNPDTLSSTITVEVIIADFGFSITPTTLSFISGEIGTTTATISSVNGFSGVVTLSVGTNVPSPGLSVSFSSNPVTLTPGQSLNSIITLQGSPTSQITYHTQIRAATTGETPKTITLVVTVTPPVADFYFTASPTNIGPVDAGISGTSTIGVVFVNGFTGPVSLAVAASSSNAQPNLNMTSVTTTHNVTLTVSSLVAGSYTLNVTGTGSSQGLRSIAVSLSVLDFNLTVSPNPIEVASGQSTNTAVTVTGLNGFSGDVTLTSTASTGLTASFSQNTITGSGTVVLTVAAASTLASGLYTVNVTGVSTPLSHTVQVNVTVLPTDFRVTAVPTTIVAGILTNNTSTITITSLNGFSGTVDLTVQAPAEVVYSLNQTFSTMSIPLAGGESAFAVLTLNSTSAGSFAVNVTGVSGSLTHSITVQFNATAVQDFSIVVSPASLHVNLPVRANATVTVTSLNSFSGLITLTSNYTSPCSLTPATLTGSGGSVLSCKFAAAGSYHVKVTGTSGTLSHSQTITVGVGDFDIFNYALGLTVYEGSSTTFKVNLSSLAGFQGTLTLTPNVTPPTGFSGTGIPSATLDSSTVTLTASGPNSSQNVTVTIVVGRDVEPQNFQVVINATTGSGVSFLSHATIQLNLVVPRPSVGITSSPTSIVVGPGSSSTSSGSGTVVLTSQNGMNGTIDLSLSYSKSGVSCSLESASLLLKVADSNNTGLTCSAPIGSYNVTITGTGVVPYGATMSFAGYAGFVVADFVISPTPSGGILINAGQTGHSRIAISWDSNYDGTVTFSVAPVAGLNMSFSSTSLTGPGSTTLDIVANTAGTYTVTVTATSGSDSHTATFTVTVLANEQTLILGLTPEVFYSIVGVVILAVAAAGLIMYRRSVRMKREARRNR